MTPETLILALVSLTLFTAVVLYAINQATVRIEIRDRQDRATQRAWITAMGALETVIERQQDHIEKVLGISGQDATPAVDPQQQLDEVMSDLAGWREDIAVDEPDWSDAFVPREATGRVAGIRPGQSPIPGVSASAVDGDSQPNYDEYEWAGE